MPFILPVLKEKGNEAFVKGDYETAVLYYSEGLEKMKDMKVLYTNRAQVGDPGQRPQWQLRERVLGNLSEKDSFIGGLTNVHQSARVQQQAPVSMV